MSRPITLSDNVIASIIGKLAEELKGHKVFRSKVDLSYSVPDYEDARASLVFEPVAFAKMLALVNNFDTEVAWHGTATRDGDTFRITDILVYPQEVTGGTVNTDQEAYQTWLYGLDDEQFNNLRFQGHSHVNFGTSPSSVDLEHQEKIVEQLEDNMFYIFLIWNKKMDYTVKIFDLANNTLYENNDVDIFVGDAIYDGEAFYKNAKEMVKTKTYTSYNAYDKAKDNSKSYKKSKSKGLDKEDYEWMNDFFRNY